MKRIAKNCVVGTAVEISRLNRKLHDKNLYKVFIEEGFCLEKDYKLFIIDGMVVTVKYLDY